MAVATASTAGAAPSYEAANASGAWPGGTAVSTADAKDVFGEDLSGLYQEGSGSSAALWAAQNSGKIWRLIPDGSGGWKPDTAGSWANGEKIHYPDGAGTPDDEGITLTGAGSAGGVYTSTERDGDNKDTSRMSVLRYDVSGGDGNLAATHEWNLTSDLPKVDANSGLEGITWVPDSALTGKGFKDVSTGAAYDPSHYGSHTGGVFFVGLEGTGAVYGYVLEDSGKFTRVSTFSSGMSGVMELQWEPQTSRMWAVCDDTCDGQHRTFTVGSAGQFTDSGTFARPVGMPNYNNEGFTLAPAAACSDGTKPVYWSDDGNDDSHALRKGTVNC